jgi:hypothetical protein
MNVLRKILVGLGSIVVVALVLALASPKTIRAAVSALVTVTNTPANPVNTLAADAATAFVEQGTCSFNAGFGPNICTVFPIYTVPSGQIAVIDSATGTCQVDPGVGQEVLEFRLVYLSPSGSTIAASIAPAPVFQFPGLGVQGSTGGQNLRTYASAGAISLTAVAGNTETNTTDFCRFVLSGHLVTP